jgi:hypothetical protein
LILCNKESKIFTVDACVLTRLCGEKMPRLQKRCPFAIGGSACGEKAATPLMPNARCEVRQLKRVKSKTFAPLVDLDKSKRNET